MMLCPQPPMDQNIKSPIIPQKIQRIYRVALTASMDVALVKLL